MKICTKCKIEKELTEFSKDKTKKDNLKSQCKICTKQWRRDNKEYFKQWREDNKDKIIKDKIIKDKIIKDKIIKDKIIKDKIIKPIKEKYNKQRINERRKIYEKEKRKNDNLFKLKVLVRNFINSSVKKNGFTKKRKSFEFLGCSFQEFKLHLESKFQPWMNWGNHGLYNGDFNYGWDIDHIQPLASAKSEEEIIKLNHYTNLQPLCSKINRYIKRDKLDVLYFHEI